MSADALRPSPPQARVRTRLLLAGVALALTAAGAWALLSSRDDPPPADPASVVVASQHGLYEVAVRPPPARAPVNRLHRWHLRLRDADGEPVSGASVDVDGDMPAHGHGLPTQPIVRELGGGRYDVEGMQFQMGGAWYVRFRIAAAPGEDAARVDFRLPDG